MADLTTSVEARLNGRNWLNVKIGGRIVGQLCVHDDELDATLRAIPMEDSCLCQRSDVLLRQLCPKHADRDRGRSATAPDGAAR